MKKSIRWRLALSFAAIALLAAGALGAVLLLTVRRYYVQQEREYLDANAAAVSEILAFALQDETPLTPTLRAQLEGFAFLSQSRIRYVDAAGEVLVDTGTPDPRVYMALNAPDDVMFSVVAPSAGAPIPETWERTIEITKNIVGQAPDTNVMLISSLMTPTLESGGMIRADAPPGIFFQFAQRTEVNAPITESGGDQLVSTVYGLGGAMGEVSADASWRSDQVVRTPLYNAAGDEAGVIEISEGPAYGVPILISVARAWALAGVVAVVLAAGVGWLMSRNLSAPVVTLTAVTTRMASGDLKSRAPATTRADELGALSRTFNQMADRVEETVTTLREFVSDAAHELHTPLTALRTNLELAGESDAVLRAQAQVTRLEALTAGLLDLSRIEAGVAEFAPVDVAALSREVAELYASQAEQADIVFTVTTPDVSVMVKGDAAHLSRALTNLLDNALKFTPGGGGVQFTLDVEEDAAVIRVEDTGIGIPAVDLPHLFNRFHRGRNTAEYPGSGLGLAIVRAIVESHGGKVQAENTAAGARFTLRLPINSNVKRQTS